MKNRIVVTALLVICTISISAQGEYFEGELHSHGLANGDGKLGEYAIQSIKTANAIRRSINPKYSPQNEISMAVMEYNKDFNQGYNGTFITKENKFVLHYEEKGITQIFDGDKKMMTYVFDLIGKGVQINFDSYHVKSMFTGNSRKGMLQSNGSYMVPTLYRFEKDEEKREILGRECNHVSGRIEKGAITNIYDFYCIPTIKMAPILYNFLTRGIDSDVISGLIARMEEQMISIIPIIGEVGGGKKNPRKNYKDIMKHANENRKNMEQVQNGEMTDMSVTSQLYVGWELDKIIPRKVDDAEFSVPEGIVLLSVDDSNMEDLNRIMLENYQYLDEHNMLPSQINREKVTFETEDTFE